ncbi:MAG: hypothetical protein V1885_00040 [Candidatus Brennerbacteria bacterium]
MIPVLEISLALLFFANKVLWLIGKRAGWLVGLVAAVGGIYYFILIKLYIFASLEVGLAALMWYGFSKGDKVNPRIEVLVRIALTAIMAFLTYFLFSGVMTAIEFFATLFSLWGTYFLAGTHVRWGWAIMGVGHVMSTIVFFDTNQDFFAHFQIASVIVAGTGVWKEMEKAAPKPPEPIPSLP